jgi:hypothetical protein
MGEVEKLRWLLERQLAWIAAADSKLAVVGTLPLAMLGLSLVNLRPQLAKISWIDLPLLGSTILLSISLICVVAALIPRLNGPEQSNIYFGKISEQGGEAFKSSVLSESIEDFQRDLVDQIFINAKIAHVKHKNVSRAIVYLVFAGPLWLLSIALGYGFVAS